MVGAFGNECTDVDPPSGHEHVYVEPAPHVRVSRILCAAHVTLEYSPVLADPCHININVHYLEFSISDSCILHIRHIGMTHMMPL